jgi:hypothetical protein
MPVNVPNPGNYLASIGDLFTQIRDRMQDVIDQNNYIGSMGGETFLTAAFPDGLGMTPDDAGALLAALGNHTAVAHGYQGGPPAPQLDYKANGSPFWNGR